MDQLNSFIREAHERDIKITESLATIAQSQKDLSARLFGGSNQVGVLAQMVAACNTSHVECKESRTNIQTRVSSLETWRTGTIKWVAGVVAVLALEGTALGAWLTHAATVAQKLK